MDSIRNPQSITCDLPPIRNPQSAIRNRLLGVFILIQLAFLAFTTAEVVFRQIIRPGLDRRFDPEHPADAEKDLILLPHRAWLQLTEQRQYWRLFPRFPEYSVFPVVRLVWAVPMLPPVEISSPFEPSDPYRRLDLDHATVRLFNFEGNVTNIYIHWDEKTLAEEPPEYRDYRAARMRERWPVLQAFMYVKVREFLDEHPGSPPLAEVVLLVREYATPRPGQQPWRYGEPVLHELARWRFAGEWPAKLAPLEAYDPKVGFFAVTKEP